MNRVKYLINKNLHHSMSIECMSKNISLHLDAIDASRWIDNEVQPKNRDMCIKCIRNIFAEFEGKKANEKTLREFILAVHEAIKKEIQS